jgi:hypothetical protein
LEYQNDSTAFSKEKCPLKKNQMVLDQLEKERKDKFEARIQIKPLTSAEKH